MKSKLTLFLILSVLFLLGGTAAAAEYDRRKVPPGIQADPANRLAPASRVRITDSRAAALVKQRHKKAKVLGVSLLERGGSPVYKVRTLSSKGVVRSVFVDGRTGEVFD